MPCKYCTWYKIMTIKFWKDWRLLTPLKSKSIVSQLEGLAVIDPICEPTIEVKCYLIDQYVKNKVDMAHTLLMEAVLQ